MALTEKGKGMGLKQPHADGQPCVRSGWAISHLLCTIKLRIASLLYNYVVCSPKLVFTNQKLNSSFKACYYVCVFIGTNVIIKSK